MIITPTFPATGHSFSESFALQYLQNVPLISIGSLRGKKGGKGRRGGIYF